MNHPIVCKIRGTHVAYASCLLVLMFLFTIHSTGCKSEQTLSNAAAAELMVKANSFAKQEQYDEAVCRLKSAADLSPEAYQVHYNLGVLYSQIKDWEPSIEHLEMAIKLNPKDVNSYYALGYSAMSLTDLYSDALNGQASMGDKKPSAQDLKDNPALQLAVDTSAEVLTQRLAASRQKTQNAYANFLKLAPENDPGRQEASQILQELR